jgi:hypothetical protein
LRLRIHRELVPHIPMPPCGLGVLHRVRVLSVLLVVRALHVVVHRGLNVRGPLAALVGRRLPESFAQGIHRERAETNHRGSVSPLAPSGKPEGDAPSRVSERTT